jgi:hypothetical protein
LNSVDRFAQKAQIPSFTNIRAVEAELFHAEGQTDMTKLSLFAVLGKRQKNSKKNQYSTGI